MLASVMSAGAGELGFRLVIGDGSLAHPRRLSELNLGKALRLPEGNEALAEGVLSWLLSGHVRGEYKVHF